jgi:hypothetical protein
MAISLPPSDRQCAEILLGLSGSPVALETSTSSSHIGLVELSPCLGDGQHDTCFFRSASRAKLTSA